MPTLSQRPGQLYCILQQTVRKIQIHEVCQGGNAAHSQHDNRKTKQPMRSYLCAKEREKYHRHRQKETEYVGQQHQGVNPTDCLVGAQPVVVDTARVSHLDFAVGADAFGRKQQRQKQNNTRDQADRRDHRGEDRTQERMLQRIRESDQKEYKDKTDKQHFGTQPTSVRGDAKMRYYSDLLPLIIFTAADLGMHFFAEGHTAR